MSLTEIEAREMVTDPLGAVPNVPFGHLHGTWRAFRDSVKPGDEIWSFSARWTPELGCPEQRAGYVVVRDEVMGPYFMTIRKRVGELSQH